MGPVFRASHFDKMIRIRIPIGIRIGRPRIPIRIQQIYADPTISGSATLILSQNMYGSGSLSLNCGCGSYSLLKCKKIKVFSKNYLLFTWYQGTFFYLRFKGKFFHDKLSKCLILKALILKGKGSRKPKKLQIRNTAR